MCVRTSTLELRTQFGAIKFEGIFWQIVRSFDIVTYFSAIAQAFEGLLCKESMRFSLKG